VSDAPTPALILVGGLGMRLRSAVGDLPKALAPVAGRPFLEYKIEHLRRAGLTDVVLAIGYGADAIRGHFGDGARHGVRIRYSLETTPLGTAGALRLARPLLAGPFFALNGDTFVEADYAAMARAHAAAGTIGAVALRPVDDAGRYGAIELDDTGLVRRFREKAAAAPGLINAGVYRFTPAVFDAIASDGPASLEYDVLPALAERGELIGLRAEGYFMDIGLPETLHAFEADVRRGAVPGG
jgi:NDP-sugar pyrophosphorylase family protein